jgi:hypothetical protein
MSLATGLLRESLAPGLLPLLVTMPTAFQTWFLLHCYWGIVTRQAGPRSLAPRPRITLLGGVL